ncbi:hypothetical protein [Streptomyces sp. NPDC047108]|uniref:hypothetical protein n=1 Tax=Streptomyces sp. NPDC047108 TaxID=3155025 RepID=UPI0033F52DB4
MIRPGGGPEPDGEREATAMGPFYKRAGRTYDVDRIDASLRAAIAAHAEGHQLGDVLGRTALCFETDSVRLRKPGLFARLMGTADPDTSHRTLTLVAPPFVVVVVTGERRGVHVRSARLDAVSLDESPFPGGIDKGVRIAGMWSGSSEGASFFLGVGDDAEGRRLLDTLRTAVTEAKSG